MKRITSLVCAALTMLTVAEVTRVDASSHTYGGYQPWWNIFAKRNRCMTAEEERLQRFWHDYYDALHHYYKSLDHIDWVSYYKNHGYQINAGCTAYGQNGGSQRVQFAPVFVSPQMQWAVPGGCLNGPPTGQPGTGMMPNMGAFYGYGQ